MDPNIKLPSLKDKIIEQGKKELKAVNKKVKKPRLGRAGRGKGKKGK